MKKHLRIAALLLALILCAAGSSALAEGLEHPESWLGTWEGGEDYGDARDYYLELTDYHDGVFDANLLYYRLSNFEGMSAFVADDATAVLSTSAEDDYTVLATLDFFEDGIEMRVLDSDDLYLKAGTVVRLERSKDQ